MEDGMNPERNAENLGMKLDFSGIRAILHGIWKYLNQESDHGRAAYHFSSCGQ